MASLPKFAVVGHPNKGKSSIVSTLSQDERVSVGEDPGTTSANAIFSLDLGDSCLFELVDTPGFQRPRKVLKWMKQHEQGAASHPDVVKRFVEDSQASEEFPDEVELLKPIVGGAGILYVVDGSTPYGSEYDSELEILRWSGQPRMALINPIGDAKYVDEWKNALGQFFSVVRVFDALEGEFDKQLELLRAFGQLNEEWRSALDKAVSVLERDRLHKKKESASIVARMLVEVLSLKEQDKLESSDSQAAQSTKLQSKLEGRIVEKEQEARDLIEKLYRYDKLKREEDELASLNEIEIFSEKSWKLFGLNKKDLVTFSAVGGAATGGVLDIASGGGSLMMGSLLGGIIGASTSFFAAEKLVDSKLVFLPLGERLLVVGPVTNIGFPHMLLERARLHHGLLEKRTHANRSILDMREQTLPEIPDSLKRKLEKQFRKIRKSGASVEGEDVLRELVFQVLG